MNFIDLFAGCGGLSLGFQNAGMRCLAAYEKWKPAIDVHEANFDHGVHNFDLSDYESAIREISKHKPTLIAGGPPCQDFSHAGKRTEGERANLTLSYAKIIEGVRPKWFVMENVPRAQKSQAFDQARNIFHSSGYGLTEIVLDASLCGVPQARKRFFCIGKIGEEEDFLLGDLISNQSAQKMTLRDHFGDSLGVNDYYRHPRNYNRRAVFSIDEPSPTIRGVNRPIPSGYASHKGDTADVSSDLVRPLTSKERAMIQTFPANFKWIGSKTAKEQIIGNAVPVNLAKFVGSCIKNYESRRRERTPIYVTKKAPKLKSEIVEQLPLIA